MARFIACVVLSVSVFLPKSSAQQPAEAGRQAGPAREVETSTPEFNGVKANAPIDGKLHEENEAGSDGLGLCVYTSNMIDGKFQGVAELIAGKESDYWKYVKGRPGGSYPQKFARDMEAMGFKTPWFQYEGTSAEALDMIEHYNSQGLPVGITINYGDRYGQNIHHMVSLVHIDRTMACYVDNNFPGVFFWITRDELARRFEDGPKGWFVVILWTKKHDYAFARIAGGVFMSVLGCVVFFSKGRNYDGGSAA